MRNSLAVVNMPESLRHVICPLTDIPDPGAFGFSVPGARFPDEWFVVRHGDSLHAYHNLCPHAGNFLNWKANAFLTRDKSLIMCSAHGALFDPATGACVAGPCLGRSLRQLPIMVEEGMLVAYFERDA